MLLTLAPPFAQRSTAPGPLERRRRNLWPDIMTAPETGAVPGGANVIKLSQRDLLDYRAVQRTFDGAYARTALGQLCYAIVILRLFQPKFFYVGECFLQSQHEGPHT